MLKNRYLNRPRQFPAKGELNSLRLPRCLLKASVCNMPIFLTQYRIDGLNRSDKTSAGHAGMPLFVRLCLGTGFPLCTPRGVHFVREKFTFRMKCKSVLQALGGCMYRHPYPHVHAIAKTK